MRKQLTDIESDLKEGKYKKPDGGYPSGSAEVDHLVRKCLLWSDIVLDRCVTEPYHLSVTDSTDENKRKGHIPESFKPLYDQLVRIRNDLDKLSLTGKWALREADLYDYTRELDRIDELRVRGNWYDEDGREAELYVQRVSTTLLT